MRVLHPEWRDYQEPTKYPFSDDARMINDAGDFLGESTFLDAIFYPIGGQARLHLSAVDISHDQATLWLGDPVNSSLASVEFDLLSPPDSLKFVDAYGRPAGLIVSEATRLAIFQSWSLGEHLFDVDDSEFVASVCVPTPEIGFRGFLLEDGSIVAGDVWLVGDDGVALRRELTSVHGPDGITNYYETIRVDAVGDPLFRRRLCSNVFSTPKFVQTITVQSGCRKVICGPDAFGDFKITVGNHAAADTILRIRTTSDGIVIEAAGEALEGVR